MQRRGRSRQVSHVALARQASEERRSRAEENIQRTLYVRATQQPQQPLPSTLPRKPSMLCPTPPPQPPIQVSADASSALDTDNTATATIPIATPVPVPVITTPPFLRSDSPSPSSTPASLSPDYYDSPPSPPRSLEDQVHVAYALDDIHLAKVLLLKLKGIEVTSDDDPRIAAVQDEDFDMCFVPSGGLLNEADEKAVLEGQRKERERWEEKQRVDRLRACERIWEEEKRRLRQERLMVLKKREDEERQRLLEEEQMRLAKEREAAVEAERVSARHQQKLRVGSIRHSRGVVSYASLTQTHLPSSSSASTSASSSLPKEKAFVYSYMPPASSKSASTTPPRRLAALPNIKSQSQSQDHTRRILHSSSPTAMGDGCLSVTFKDVLSSMEGSLFPLEPSEQRSHYHRSTSPHSYPNSENKGQRRRKREADLLDGLFKFVEWEKGERRRIKGKGKIVERVNSHKSMTSATSKCAACSAAQSPPSPPSPTSTSTSPSSTVSRASSWLSFGSSRNSGTSSSVATTPSTSPISSWLKSSSPKTVSFALPVTASPPPEVRPSAPIPLRHSCHSRSKLTPVPPSESPLPLAAPLSTPLSSQTKEEPKEKSSDGRNANSPRRPGPGKLLVKRMSQFMELAKGFQVVYMNAAVFSVAASFDSYEDRWVDGYETVKANGSVSPPRARIRREEAGKGLRLKPAGYRVRSVDVSSFSTPFEEYSPPAVDEFAAPREPVYIPLTSPFPSAYPPRTILPSPLPYPKIFKPHPPLTRSPLRRYLPPSTHDNAQVIHWRMRPVANPVYLRLKALQNIVWERGVNWEGKAREGGLGTGREKLCGIAFEGLGRSWLSVGAGEAKSVDMVVGGVVWVR